MMRGSTSSVFPSTTRKTPVTKINIIQNTQGHSELKPQPSASTPDPGNEKSRTTEWMNKIQARLKFSPATVLILPSVMACILVQAVAAFFYITTLLTLVTGAVQNARDFSEDPSHDGYVLIIVFSVFFSAAVAMCAPLIYKAGYATIIVAGSVLMMYSTLSSSVVTSADALVIPYSIFGACAYGLLKTAPEVAMLDFLSNRPSLAILLNQMGVSVGQLVGVITFMFSDMFDDANYGGSGNARWPNNMRVIEVTTVFSLMSAAVLRKPSFKTGNWPEIFLYIPFYILCLVNFLVSFGFSMIVMVYSSVPEERDFKPNASGSHEIFTVGFISQIVELLTMFGLLVINLVFCKNEGITKNTLLLSTISVAVLAAASYINEPAYKNFGSFAVYGILGGFVKALVRICLPIAMFTYTGRVNYKIGIPFLELSGGLGDLFSNIIKDATDMPDDEPLETGWYIAATCFTIAAPVCFYVHWRYIPWDTEMAKNEDDEDGVEDVEAVENAEFAVEDPLSELDGFDMSLQEF